ncbi:MAG: S-layer homology domain-containing protein, partial [Acidobacteriota bacterium]
VPMRGRGLVAVRGRARHRRGCRFVHFLAAKGITSGCGGGNYCPSSSITRWQMAVFLAGALAGADASVPVSGTVPGLGDYTCGVGGQSVFLDVPPTDPGCKHVHYIAARGITSGCGGGNYCPTSPLGRDQMAVFLTKAFDLALW